MRIKICEFNSRNKIDSEKCYIEVEKDGFYYWYINYRGDRSYKYNGLNEAKSDIKKLYGEYYGFKMLI